MFRSGRLGSAVRRPACLAATQVDEIRTVAKFDDYLNAGKANGTPWITGRLLGIWHLFKFLGDFFLGIEILLHTWTLHAFFAGY